MGELVRVLLLLRIVPQRLRRACRICVSAPRRHPPPNLAPASTPYEADQQTDFGSPSGVVTEQPTWAVACAAVPLAMVHTAVRTAASVAPQLLKASSDPAISSSFEGVSETRCPCGAEDPFLTGGFY
eukprot:364536-Chlamydomonas_euryale.AAC.11